MKILIIQPSLPSYRIPFFTRLAERLGQQITILHFGKPRNITHPLVKEKIGEDFRFKGLIWVKRLHQEIKGFNLIIQVFDPHFMNLFFLPLFVKNMKTILWSHGLGKSDLSNKIRKLIYKQADAIVTYSMDGKNKLIELGLPSEKIFVAQNTVHVPNHQDTSSMAMKNFLYMGRLQRRKRLDIFLQVFYNLSLGEKGYKFQIVGDGEEEKRCLLSLINKLNLADYVELHPGTFDDSKLYEYFKESLFYVSPGPVGLGVLHSFAYGVPVLTMASHGHGPELKNIINDSNGMVFKDRLEFERLLPKYLDEKIAVTMGQNAYNHYKEFASIENMVEGFVAAIESIT